MSARRILLLGAPGAGKGTQAKRLVQKLGATHVSTGEMLRAAVAAGSEIGKQVEAVMERGDLVSDDIVVAVARERLNQPDAASGFVLDGFPRTVAQAEALDVILNEAGTPLERCIALEADEEAIVERLLKRAEAEGRADDTEETIRNRMRVYRQQTQPLAAHYRAAGILVEVDGIGSMDTVAERVQGALG